MFPNIPLLQLNEMLAHDSLSGAVDKLLEGASVTSSLSPSKVLNDYAKSVVNESKEISITISRSSIWNAALQFYKSAKSYPEKLTFKLNVEFDGEEGIDGGALRSTYFELALKEGDEKLFEGATTARLPKKDMGLECYFELFGILVVHSIVHGGPSLRNICPAIYEYIITEADMERTSETLCISDIPLNMANVHYSEGVWPFVITCMHSYYDHFTRRLHVVHFYF